MNPLAPLPDELILEIFEQLIRLWELGSRGTMRIVPATTFAALALSCRYLYPFAMRFLYSTYHASLEAPLISFLRTIASQPHLVMRIKDIQTTDLRDDDYFDGCTLSRTTEAMAAEIRTAALPYEQKWLAELAFEPEEVDVALLVLRSRKLQSLVIVRRWLGHASYQELPIVLDPIVEFCKKLPVEPTQAYDYKKLRRLDIRMSGLCLGQVAHILRLPSLTSLALQDFAYNDALIAREKRLQWPVSPGTSGLQKVYILSSTIPSDVLVSLLESCKAVKSFEYMASMIPVAPVQWYADTLRALGMHRDTLEQLCIDSDEGDVAFWDRGLPAYLPCAIIKGMQSLTRLKINFVVLMGKPRGRYQVHDADRTQDLEWRGYISTLRDLLPPNLAELTLLMDRSSLTWDVDYDRQLWTLLPTDPSSSTSSIDALHIKYDHDIPAGKFPIRLSDLAKRCKQAGVAYAYTAYALVDDRCKVISVSSHHTVFVRSNTC